MLSLKVTAVKGSWRLPRGPSLPAFTTNMKAQLSSRVHLARYSLKKTKLSVVRLPDKKGNIIMIACEQSVFPKAMVNCELEREHEAAFIILDPGTPRILLD